MIQTIEKAKTILQILEEKGLSLGHLLKEETQEKLEKIEALSDEKQRLDTMQEFIKISKQRQAEKVQDLFEEPLQDNALETEPVLEDEPLVEESNALEEVLTEGERLAEILEKEPPQIIAFVLARFPDELRDSVEQHFSEKLRERVRSRTVEFTPLSDRIYEKYTTSSIPQLSPIYRHGLSGEFKKGKIPAA